MLTRREHVALALTAWVLTSTLLHYPHTFTYFNEAAGGALCGPKHLLASSTDWGQDLHYLREWIARYPERREQLQLAWAVPLVDPKSVGIDVPLPPDPGDLPDVELPIYCVISVNELYAPHDKYLAYRRREPLEMIGYWLCVFKIE